MTRVRVMTYNILRGGRRGSALHEVVRGAAPDVVLVNESPKSLVGGKRRCRALADTWQLTYVAGGRAAGANLLAVGAGVRVKSVATRALPTPLLKPRRGIVAAQLRVDGKLIGVVGCHLGLDREARSVELAEVLAAADRLRGPVVLAGDLNERANGPSWQRLAQAGFVDHGTRRWQTYPAEVPDRRIDALLVRGVATVSHHGDPGLPADLLVRASDHRPVLALVDF